MNSDIIKKRIGTLEKKVFGGAWCIVTYKDGSRARLKIIDALAPFIEGEPVPQIESLSFGGDVSREGVLPALLEYLAIRK